MALACRLSAFAELALMLRWSLLGCVLLAILGLAGWWFLKAPALALLALILTQPLAFLALLLPGIRLARLAGSDISAADGFGAVCVSVLLFKILPSRLSESAKPLLLTITAGCPLAKGFAAIAFERFLDIVCIAILMAIILSAKAPQSPALLTAFWIFLSLIVIGIAALAFLIRKPALVDNMIAWLPFAVLRRMLNALTQAARQITQTTVFWPVFGLSLGTWASAFAIFQLYFTLAGSIPLTWDQILTVYVFSTIGLAIALAPGGLGTYEAAVIGALALYGYPLDEALISALVLRLANMAPAIPGTFWYLSRHKLDFRELLSRVRKGAGS